MKIWVFINDNMMACSLVNLCGPFSKLLAFILLLTSSCDYNLTIIIIVFFFYYK